MKTQILFLMILFISCVNDKKESTNEEKNIAVYDSLKSIDNQHESIDTLTFKDLDSALLVAEKVKHLTIEPRYNPILKISKYYELVNLPSQIGSFVNLKTLEIHCLEKLDELPFEIGKLKKLEKLIINNGNGCVMNVRIPSSIGELQNLKELTLYGALDAEYFERMDSIDKTTNPLSKVKNLPNEISELKNLEVLDLGRNGIDYFPPQIENLIKLRILRLEYSNIKEIPSYISKLKNLEEIDIRMNGRVILPNSLGEFKNLKIFMGDCELKLKDQAELRKRFPNITFDFENEYIQGSNEQETP